VRQALICGVLGSTGSVPQVPRNLAPHKRIGRN
jgi:hypothetical protein